MSEGIQLAKEDDDGDDNRDNEARAKRSRNNGEETQTKLRNLSSSLQQERREAAAKASVARQTTLPDQLKKLRRLINRIKDVDDQITVLLDETPEIMEVMVTCTQDLLQWISLSEPSISMGSNSGPTMSDKIAKIVEIQQFCFDGLVSINGHFDKREEIAQEYKDRPQSDENQKALEAHDKAAADEWMGKVETLLRYCETMAHIIDSYGPLVERVDDSLAKIYV